MKSGDQIKAFVQVGLMKKPKWTKGTLIASNRNLGVQELKDLGFKVRVKHEDEYLVDVAGNRLYLKPQDVREWRPLKFGPSPEFKCDKMEQFVANNWEDLKLKCKNSIAEFFPKVSLKIDEKEKTISVEDSHGPYLTVASAVMEKQSIASFFETPAWEVVLWVSIPATRWEPANVDEKNCGFAETTIGAARLLVDNIWRCQTDDYWQSLQDAELCSGEGEQW
jgi:hypothetical protein